MHYCYLDSPAGRLLIAGDDEALRYIGFPDKTRPRKPEPGWIESMQGSVAAAVAQLREYFAGRRKCGAHPRRHGRWWSLSEP